MDSGNRGASSGQDALSKILEMMENMGARMERLEGGLNELRDERKPADTSSASASAVDANIEHPAKKARLDQNEKPKETSTNTSTQAMNVNCEDPTNKSSSERNEERKETSANTVPGESIAVEAPVEEVAHAWVHMAYKIRPDYNAKVPSCALLDDCDEECGHRDEEDERESEIPFTFTLHSTKEAAMAMHSGEEGSLSAYARSDLIDSPRLEDGFIVIWAAPEEQRVCECDDYDSWDAAKRRLKWACHVGSGIRCHGVYATERAAQEGATRTWMERYMCNLFSLEDGDMYVLPASWRSVHDAEGSSKTFCESQYSGSHSESM